MTRQRTARWLAAGLLVLSLAAGLGLGWHVWWTAREPLHIELLQSCLAAINYNPGPVDGQPRLGTQTALAQWATARGLDRNDSQALGQRLAAECALVTDGRLFAAGDGQGWCLTHAINALGGGEKR
jgi:hypothetical protein